MSVAPPRWAKRVRFVSKNGKSNPGAKLLWLTLWGYAPLDRAADHEGENREPVRVWPTRSTLAEELGESLDTIKTWLKRVVTDGWVRRAGNVWELAVGCPFEHEGVSAHPPRVSAHPGLSSPAPGLSSPAPGLSSPGSQLTRPGSQLTRPGSQLTRGEGLSSPPEVEGKKKLSRKEEEPRASAGASEPLALPGLDPPVVDPKAIEAAAFAEFWDWYNAERAAAFARWRPDVRVPTLELSAEKRAKLTRLCQRHAPKGATAAEYLDVARKVIRVARRELDRDRARVSDSGWDPMRRLYDYWLRREHFDRMALEPEPKVEPPTMKFSDGPNVFDDDRYGGLEYDEIALIYGDDRGQQ